MKQKQEDDEGKKSLKAELAQANNIVAKLNKEQEATPRVNINKVQDEIEEYLTDSEEERVLRNKHVGRGFLRAKRSLDRPQNLDYKCAKCNEQFKTETEQKSHMKNYGSGQ